MSLTGGIPFLGHPLLFERRLHGAVLVEAHTQDQLGARRILRHLEWSAGWVGAHIAAAAAAQAGASRSRALFMLESLDAVLAADRHVDAARVFAEILRERCGADLVAVGRWEHRRSRLAGIAQTALFDRRSDLARMLARAGEEAADQLRALAVPPPDGETLVLAAHDALRRACDGRMVLSLPMADGDGVLGTVTLVRQEPFRQEEIDLLDAMAMAFAPLLEGKAQADRSLGRIVLDRATGWARALVGASHLDLKLAAFAAVALVTTLALVEDDTFVRAKGEIQGEVRRVIAAPYDGFVKSEHARAGDVVRTGAVMAELQDSDQTLDRLRHLSQKRQYENEVDRAMAKRDLAAVNIARAQVAQADAALALDDEMIRRASLTAPFDAVVVKGDLSQAVGRPVSRGEILFEVAPLDRYRLVLAVPEADVRLLSVKGEGELLLQALPDRAFRFTVDSVTPVTHAAEGQNSFEAIATLTEVDERMRPGMQGVAKINSAPHSYLWIWTRSFLAWVRIKAWSVLP